MNKYKRPLVFVGTRSDMEPYLDIAEELGIPVLGILDRFYTGQKFAGLDVIGSDLDLLDSTNKEIQELIEQADFFVASFFGGRTNIEKDSENTFQLRMERIELVKRSSCNLVNLIHPDTHISPTARIGRNTFILPGTYIEAHANISSFCQFMYHNGIAHHSVIGENCAFMPDSGTTGDVVVGKNVLVGINSRLLSAGGETTTIGDNVIVGPGMTVLKSIPNDSTVLVNGKIVANEHFTEEAYKGIIVAPTYKRLTIES